MASLLGGGPAPAPQQPRAPIAAPVASGAAAGGRVAVRNEFTGISEHSSTRVHAAPGGRSDMASLLAGGPVAPSNAPTAGAALPAATPAPIVDSTVAPALPAAGQRVMVRTEHMGIQEHSSTRVHAAPGGQSDMASIMSGGGGSDVANDRIEKLKAMRRSQATGLTDTTNTA